MSIAPVTPPDPNAAIAAAPPSAPPPVVLQPFSTPQAGPASAPQPSLWESVVVGALAGLAGSAGQKSFGGGVAAGAGGVLAQQQQQKENARADQQQANSNQEAQDEHTKSQAQTAQAYAAMANTIHQTALLPTDRQAAILDARTQQTEDLRKNGSMVPAGQPTTHEDVLQQVAQLHATNPTHFYSPEPIKGDDGKVQWQAMESPDVPLQEDAKLYLPDGSTRTVPKGSITVKQLAQAQQLALNQQVTNMSTKAQAAKTTAEEAKMIRPVPC